jgi:TPR repeat protein
MTMADAEVGDRFAANFIGECYRNGTNGVTADPIQALAWLRYAAEMGNPSSARTLAQTDATSLNRTPAEILHWTAVRDACEYNEFLPKPPRRPIGGRIDLTAVRPQLEAAISALNTFRTKKPGELTAGQEDAEMIRTDTAKAALQKNPAHGLVLLAQIAATGNRYIAHDITNILARGDYGLQPDAALAQRFHTAALGLLERDAEYGDMNAAARLAAYALGLGEKPDIPGVLRWLTYSAELGSSDAAETLARLYTDGAPGLPADAKKATRWTAFAESTNSDNFKPREPLRK